MFANGAYLECHEFVVRLRGPCVDLDRVLKRNHQELDALVLDDLEVYGALQVAHIDPAVAAFDLLLYTHTHTNSLNSKLIAIHTQTRHQYANSHRTAHRCAESSTSATTDSTRGRDSFYPKSSPECSGPRAPPSAGTGDAISADTPCPGPTDPAASGRSRCQSANWRPTGRRTESPNWSASCTCESPACRCWRRATAASRSRWRGSRDATVPIRHRRHRSRTSGSCAVSVGWAQTSADDAAAATTWPNRQTNWTSFWLVHDWVWRTVGWRWAKTLHHRRWWAPNLGADWFGTDAILGRACWANAVDCCAATMTTWTRTLSSLSATAHCCGVGCGGGADGIGNGDGWWGHCVVGNCVRCGCRPARTLEIVRAAERQRISTVWNALNWRPLGTALVDDGKKRWDLEIRAVIEMDEII